MLSTPYKTSYFASSEVTIRAIEERVNFSMMVIRPSKVKTLLERSHFNDPENKQSDFVTVLDIKPIKSEDTKFNDSSVALVSIFYDFPVVPFENRVSKHLSVNVNEFIKGEPNKLSVPVSFTLTRTSVQKWDKSMIPTCSFLNPSTNRDDWQFYGCVTTNQPDSSTTSCRCNHTTNFAVLMKFTKSELPETHNKALQIISLVLGSISAASLGVTVFIFVRYRKTLITDRMKIHFHLVVALLCGYISLLSSSLFVSPVEKVVSIPCLVFAALTHLFYLAVFFWSLIEGVYLYYKIVLVFKHTSAECVCSYSPIIGWLIPSVIVALSFGLSQTVLKLDSEKDVYADPSTCFLSKDKTIWAFAGPVLFVLSVNLLILFKVMYVIFMSSFSSIKFSASNTSTRISESLKQSSKGALLLMPILGIPTIISLLYNLYTGDVDDTATAEDKLRVVVGTMGAYLQVILAGIQGFLIFLFYCFYNAEVRAAYNLATRRRKSIGLLAASQSKTRKQSRLPLLSNFDRTNESVVKAPQNMAKNLVTQKGEGSPINSSLPPENQSGAAESTKL